MSKTKALQRAAWLVEYLLEHEEADLKEIAEGWRQRGSSGGESLDRKTWGRVFNSIGDLFGVDISCSSVGSHDAKYYISDRRWLRKQVLLRWMMRCLHVNIQILDSMRIHNRILLEDFPSENGNYVPIKNAMCQNVKLEFEYKRYSNEFNHRKIQPYAIKTYKYRYYVLGRFDSGRFCVFSFDRMSDLVLTKEHFEMDESFDAEGYFRNFFGVFVDNDLEVQEVVVRAYQDEPNYLRDVPLHCSQRLVCICNDYSDFGYMIAPTNDFIGALLQQGDRLEVISPQWLRDNVAERIELMRKHYSDR